MFENAKSTGIEYVMNFSHSGKKVTDLSRISALLKAAGDPQDKLKFVHIAGTNGKGSIAQMFSGIFTHAGLKTGLFTSPYIIEYNDRIRINNQNIPDSRLEELALRVKEIVEKLPQREDFSQFEITQTIAFLYFAQENCDIVVLETGLGGLLDCTNVVKTSVLTVIGSVDFDHTAILGDSIEEITEQKAGIIKPNVPCVLSAGNRRETEEIVRQKAAENSALLVIPNSPNAVFECDIFGSSFEYNEISYKLSMGGAHQISNAITVIEGVGLIADQFKVTDEDIKAGLAAARVPCRLEVISREPLTILDGAHNPDGMSALAKAVAKQDKKPVLAVIGMCKDKNIAESVGKLIPYVDQFVTVDGFLDRAENKEVLAQIINKAGGSAVPAEHAIEQEIAKMQKRNPHGANLICGSLFLAAAVK